MSMTQEEAIELLRDTPIDIRSTREDDIHTLYATAQMMAIDALRPVSREQVEKAWRGCKRCTATKDEAFDLYGAYNFSVFGDAIYYWDSEDGWEGENILFCPWCGRPLTDEAVEMVLERLEALYENT